MCNSRLEVIRKHELWMPDVLKIGDLPIAVEMWVNCTFFLIQVNLAGLSATRISSATCNAKWDTYEGILYRQLDIRLQA